MPRRSLKKRVLRASSWTLGGSLASQGMRFASNLVLTRLLFPEAFGVMAIVQAILVGVALLTDIGLSQSVVRSTRGVDPRFMDTIWTLQIAKGLLVALGMWAVSGFVATSYGQPLLADMLPVMGLVAVIGGFGSTKTALANRNVEAARLAAVDLGSQFATIVVMILLAYLLRSPWALLWGNVFGALVKTLFSHLLLHGPRNRLQWDRSALKEVFSFGGWVMLSSALTFLAADGRQLLMASLVDVRVIGLIALASGLNSIVWTAARTLSSRVFFAAYSEIWRTDPKRLSPALEKSRRVQLGACISMAAVYAVFGPAIVGLLYDPRYAAAGVFLQIQAIGLVFGILSNSYAGVLWAIGRAGLSTALVAVEVTLMFGAMSLGAHLGGPLGLSVGSAATGLLMYPVNAVCYRRLGLHHPRTDLAVLLLSVPMVLYVVHRGAWITTPL